MKLRALLFLLLLPACGGPSAAAADDGQGGKADGRGQAPLGPDPPGEPTRLPILLAHGFNASTTNIWSFYQVAERLETHVASDGRAQAVFRATVPPYNSPEERARVLASSVDAVLSITGAQQVNLIAHSMGGLDARALVDMAGYADKIASVTTIASPHLGSAIADTILPLLPDLRAADVGLRDVVDKLAALWGKTFNELADDTNMVAAFTGLSEAHSDAFNKAHAPSAHVYYQTYAGLSAVTGLANHRADEACSGQLLLHPGTYDLMNLQLAAIAPIVGHADLLDGIEPNDGMATVASARGPSGYQCTADAANDARGCFHFRGCVPADHLREVGQPKLDGPSARTGFDHLRFYENLAYDLQRLGF
jgi:triacylglycerol lipase